MKKGKAEGSRGLLMEIGWKYRSFVERATMGRAVNAGEDITYWRDSLFSKFITFLLPTCLIALIPGVFMAFKAGLLFIAYSDIIVVVSISVVALNSRLNIIFRKIFVIVLLYVLSIALIIDLSLLGPGIVYLLALSVLVTIVFPRYWGYWTVGANLLICVCCACIIHFRLFDSPLIKDYDLGTWIAVSSNEIFLSLVIVILISNTIKGLEKAIAGEQFSKNEFQQEVVRGIKYTEQLKESQSHYKSLFFQSPSPMWVLDTESLQFLQVNEAATIQYGYTNEEFISMNVEDIKLGKDIRKLHEDLELNKKTGGSLKIITEHRRKNQMQFYAEITFNSILFNGKPATLAISEDVTERMHYIQTIEKQNEHFRDIAWIQSHKVRGPLATILGLAYLFNNKEIEVDIEEIINGIQDASNKLDDVIKEIVYKSSLADIKIP